MLTAELQDVFIRRLNSVVSEYPKDANGIEIRPGYRPPFNSETGREAAIKCARARARLVEDAKIARATLRQIHAMLIKRKRGSNHGQSVAPISPTISPRPVKKNASAVKPEGVKSAVVPVKPVSPVVAPIQAASKPQADPTDDCPF